jgi:5-methylthioadenosine/S-adenosylhomocysteine deaminase
MADRILLRGGHVLTVDPQLGDIAGGDVLIEGDTIAQVGKDISADADVIDCTGSVVIPGFVDTHRHTWEAAIRSCAPDATLDDYFVEVLDSFAPLYRPEDVYVSNLAGAIECINAGITTLVDWSHINNTPEHPDAGIQGLRDAGIRAQYAYGSANTSLADYWFNSKIVIPRDDVERIRSTYFSSDDGLLTMGLATRGPGFCQDFVVREEWGRAWSCSSTTSDCSDPTRRTSTAATSATRSGSWWRTATARSPSRRRWRCRWGTGGRRS